MNHKSLFKNIFIKIYFLIPISFPNHFTGSISSGGITEIFLYKEMKFQKPSINSYCEAEVVLDDFRYF